MSKNFFLGREATLKDVKFPKSSFKRFIVRAKLCGVGFNPKTTDLRLLESFIDTEIYNEEIKKVSENLE